MALPASEMRKISVAYYESPQPSAEEIVDSIISAAQAAAQQGKWLTIYDGSGFTFVDVHDKPNPIQEDVMDGLASLGYSPRIERLGGGVIGGW